VQSHGITLSFHRKMADASRELVGPDITPAVGFESYPRFIKGRFQDYEGLGIKSSTADSKHVPSLRLRLPGNNVFWSLPEKVVESFEINWNCDSKIETGELLHQSSNQAQEFLLLWSVFEKGS
jgi:hypothetical protein